MIHKDTVQLTTLELWRTHAGPKRDHQWKDHRSAKECARAWLEAPDGRMPAEIESALAGHPDLGPIVSWSAEPEARVRFDAFGGEPANIDMLVTAEDERGPLAIAIEAKADETFGGLVSEVRAAAEKRLEANPRSKGLARLQRLLERFFGKGAADDVSLGGLRYQLLTLCAAALAHAEAIGADRAVVLVHEFVTPATDDARHAANGRDLDRFVEGVSGGTEQGVKPGEILGPIEPHCTGTSNEVRLYAGKAERVPHSS